MICCLSVCTNCSKTLIKALTRSQRNAPISAGRRGYCWQNLFCYARRIYSTSARHTTGLRQLWLNKPAEIGDLSGDFGAEAEMFCRNQNRLYISVCRFILLRICQQIEFFNYLPVFYRLHSSPLTCCQGSPTIFPSSSAVSPPHLFLCCFLLHFQRGVVI